MSSPRYFAPQRPRRRRRWGASRGAALGLTVLCAAVFVSVGPAHAAPPVGLGTAAGFAVLAGAGITNTGATTITGDVGTFPTPSQTGFGTVTLIGVNHADDAVTQQAKTDLVVAYGTAAGAGPSAAVATELGGTTLTPGVYGSPTLGITGTLTLDAQGDPAAVFIFQASSTLITASSSTVVGLNGLDPCNVFWQVGSSATLGTNSSLIGSVLASSSITATTGATVQGRLLARDGAVTLDNNTIFRPACTPPITVTTTTTIAAATTTVVPVSPVVVLPPAAPVVPDTTPGTTPDTSPATTTPASSPGTPAGTSPGAAPSGPATTVGIGGTGDVTAPTQTSAPANSAEAAAVASVASVPASGTGTVTTLPSAPAFPTEQAPGIPPSLAFTGSGLALAVVASFAIIVGASLLGLVRTRSNT